MCQIIKSVQFLLWIVMNTVTVMCASICGCSCFYIHVGDSLDLGRKKGSISLCWYTSTPGSRKALDCSYETRKIGLVNNFHCAPIFTQPPSYYRIHGCADQIVVKLQNACPIVAPNHESDLVFVIKEMLDSTFIPGVFFHKFHRTM